LCGRRARGANGDNDHVRVFIVTVILADCQAGNNALTHGLQEHAEERVVESHTGARLVVRRKATTTTVGQQQGGRDDRHGCRHCLPCPGGEFDPPVVSGDNAAGLAIALEQPAQQRGVVVGGLQNVRLVVADKEVVNATLSRVHVDQGIINKCRQGLAVAPYDIIQLAVCTRRTGRGG
jgi:hypothetical protein